MYRTACGTDAIPIMHVAGGSHVSGATSESIKKKKYAGCVLPVKSFDSSVVQHQRKKQKQLRLSSLKKNAGCVLPV